MTDDVPPAWAASFEARLAAQLAAVHDAIRESDRAINGKLNELEQSFDCLEDVQRAAETFMRGAETFLRNAQTFILQNRPDAGDAVN